MSDHPVRRVSRFVRNHPWAITREKLDAICEIIDARMRGVLLSEEEVQARIGAGPQRRETSVVNAVAVIPCYGVISRKMNMMTAISGGTSTDQFIAQVRQAVADDTVKAVVIDADSPGGTVDGMIEAADALYEMRGKGTKPIVAVANTCMASAAYWLLSQCDEIIGTPSAVVGSIGVFCVHDDLSAANEQAGYKPTYIKAGDHKAEDNEDEPLSDDARAYMQAQVDARYGDFLKAVARGRGISVATIKSDFGQGRALFAKDALAVKMIDRIATLDATISRFMGSGGGVRRAAAQAGARAMQAAVGELAAGVVPKDVSEKLAPKDTPWAALTLADFTDQPWESLSTGEKRHIAGHFGWSASMPPESFGDLKLGHHRPSDGAVVSRGVTNALSRLDQTKLPAGDASKVRAHLERHQAAFEKQDGKAAAASLRHLAAEDAPDDAIDEQAMEPVDGVCADGYELRDDGMCYPTPTPAEDDTAGDRQAAADQDAIAIALALQK